MSFKKIERAASVPRVHATTKIDDGDYALPSITRDYLLGGKATFTVTNVETGEKLTYKVRKARKEWPPDSGTFNDTYYVNVKVPGGRFPFQYVGIMNPLTGTIKTTALSVFLPGTKEYTTGAWATNVVITGKSIASTYRIEHLGKCGRCGKPLDTASNARGLHTVCN